MVVFSCNDVTKELVRHPSEISMEGRSLPWTTSSESGCSLLSSGGEVFPQHRSATIQQRGTEWAYSNGVDRARWTWVSSLLCKRPVLNKRQSPFKHYRKLVQSRPQVFHRHCPFLTDMM